MSPAPVSCFYAATDGLRLHYRDLRPIEDNNRTPVVCLSGLTRNAEDFAVLAQALAVSSTTPRRVLAFDYRGRGLSDHDPDWHHYDLATERADLLEGCRLADITAAHFIGTSRGGLHIMDLAEGNRAMIRGAVLNDIGPVLELEGLRRIKSYVGVPSAPATVADGIAQLKIGPGLHFDGLSEDEWLIYVASTFGRNPHDLHLRYDLQLARTLDGLELSKPLPDLWQQFDALRGAPLLVIRGANSDLLSAATFDAMVARWSRCQGYTVPGQGHAPLLADQRAIARIDDFLRQADERSAHQGCRDQSDGSD